MAWNLFVTILLYSFDDSPISIHSKQHQYHYAILFHLLQAISIIAYFIASLKNPGFVKVIKTDENNQNIIDMDTEVEENMQLVEDRPKIVKKKQNFKYLDMNLSNENAKDCPFEVVPYLPAYNENIIINANYSPSNFCWRCKFIRPIRSKHCYECDACICRFDHHCPFLGNCVGGKNHRFFVLFLYSQTAVVLWSFFMSFDTLFELKLNQFEHWEQILNDRGAFGWILRVLLFVLLFFMLFVTVGLSGFHSYLVGINQTTYELIKPQIMENYLRDERARKQKFKRKQQKERNEHKQIVKIVKKFEQKYQNKEEESMSDDMSSDEYDEIENDFKQKRAATPSAARSKGLESLNNFTKMYTNYFDEGFVQNLKNFLVGHVSPEWTQPLACTVVGNVEESE